MNKLIYLKPIDKESQTDIIQWATKDYKDTFFPSYLSQNQKDIEWKSSQYANAQIYTINAFAFESDITDQWTDEFIVGFVIIDKHFDVPFERKFIMIIFPEYRNQHIGSKTVKMISNMLAAVGGVELYGWNNQSSINSKFLESCGFEICDNNGDNILYNLNTAYVI